MLGKKLCAKRSYAKSATASHKQWQINTQIQSNSRSDETKDRVRRLLASLLARHLAPALPGGKRNSEAERQTTEQIDIAKATVSVGAKRSGWPTRLPHPHLSDDSPKKFRGRGGRVTISPPKNVRPRKFTPETPPSPEVPPEAPLEFSLKSSPEFSCKVVAHGVDTLVLAVDLFWKSEHFFEALTKFRCEAEEVSEPVSCKITGPDGQADWVFCVSPYGRDDYQWILTSSEYSMRIGQWLIPKKRPSVMVEIRSETLWTHGVDASVQRVLSLLQVAGGRIESIKLSRVDMCVDIQLPDACWNDDIRHHCNTRARKIDPHDSNNQLTGFSIGRGDISARLYDKVKEITEKSLKLWMFDIWGIDWADSRYKIIRVEFQLRRTTLREMGISEYEQLSTGLPYIWHTCTHKWLRLVEGNAKHSVRQKLLSWWEVVQDGFAGVQNACPLIRAKSISTEQDRLVNQLLGFVAAMTGLHLQGVILGKNELLDVRWHVACVIDTVCHKCWDSETFTQKVKQNQAKRIRHEEKFAQASRILTELGLNLNQLSKPGAHHHD